MNKTRSILAAAAATLMLAGNAQAEDGSVITDAPPTEAVTDTWITTKVKSSLLMASNVEGRAIEVSTRDGKVKLSGEVESSTERELAVEIAKGIRGVHAVDASNLEARDGRQAARRTL